MYSVRDQKSELFHKPWHAQTHGEAERNFSQMANDDRSTIFNHPEDFDLYHVGYYEDNSGILTPLDTPQFVIKAVQVKKSGLQAVQN